MYNNYWSEYTIGYHFQVQSRVLFSQPSSLLVSWAVVMKFWSISGYTCSLASLIHSPWFRTNSLHPARVCSLMKHLLKEFQTLALRCCLCCSSSCHFVIHTPSTYVLCSLCFLLAILAGERKMEKKRAKNFSIFFYSN